MADLIGGGDMTGGTASYPVEVHQVVKRFGRTRALDEVTMHAGLGVTGLLGRNGAGKTTLLRLLGTVAAADSGTLRLLGCDPERSAERDEIRRNLGYLPQDAGFYRSFTAFEFVDYVAILKQFTDRRARQDEVRRVLDLLDLTGVAAKRIRSLSGGTRQRVGIAQALLGDPELLVLDEPTRGLDPEQRLRLRDLICRLGENRCVVLSTHQTEEVAALCEQVVVLDAGRLRFAGSPADLIATAAGCVWSSGARDPAAAVAWRTADGLLRNLGTAPSGAELVAPTLEDAYLLLVAGQHCSSSAART
jgi:ABC-2 type transport system ATP-binding protein